MRKRGGTILAVLLVLVALFGSKVVPVPPGPAPAPGPDVESAWLIIVEQTEARKPETAQLLASRWLDSLADRHIRWRLYDVDAPNTQPFKRKAESVGLPAALIVAGDPPTYRAAVPLPATTAALDELIKRSTGL